MRYAVVKNNVVENMIAWDGVVPYTPPQGTILIQSDMAGPGWIWDGNNFSKPPRPEPPPPPVPESITRRQCALQLLSMQMITSEEALLMTKDGTPPAVVATVFAQMPQDQALLAQIDFAAIGYYRNNPLINVMMESAGMTPEQIDHFFIDASEL